MLAVEGNPPLNEGGMFCTDGGKPFVEKLRSMAEESMAIVAWGTCASSGCVQAAEPNPTGAVPIDKVITNRPIIKVPGCPHIAEAMTGLVTFMTAFGKLPQLDRLGRPKMFYSERIHDKCYRRSHFDAGQFVEEWDDEGHARAIAYTTWAARGRPLTMPVRPFGNGGVSFPIQSGHSALRRTPIRLAWPLPALLG